MVRVTTALGGGGGQTHNQSIQARVSPARCLETASSKGGREGHGKFRVFAVTDSGSWRRFAPADSSSGAMQQRLSNMTRDVSRLLQTSARIPQVDIHALLTPTCSMTYLVPEEPCGPVGHVELVQLEAEVVAVHGISHAAHQAGQQAVLDEGVVLGADVLGLRQGTGKKGRPGTATVAEFVC